MIHLLVPPDGIATPDAVIVYEPVGAEPIEFATHAAPFHIPRSQLVLGLKAGAVVVESFAASQLNVTLAVVAPEEVTFHTGTATWVGTASVDGDGIPEAPIRTLDVSVTTDDVAPIVTGV